MMARLHHVELTVFEIIKCVARIIELTRVSPL